MVLPNLSGGSHIYPFATISCAGGSNSNARAADPVLNYSNVPKSYANNKIYVVVKGKCQGELSSDFVSGAILLWKDRRRFKVL